MLYRARIGTLNALVPWISLKYIATLKQFHLTASAKQWLLYVAMPLLKDAPWYASEPNAPPRFHKTYAIRPQGSLQPRDCCDACHGHMDFISISYRFHGNLMGIWWSLVELITEYMYLKAVLARQFEKLHLLWPEGHWSDFKMSCTWDVSKHLHLLLHIKHRCLPPLHVLPLF